MRGLASRSHAAAGRRRLLPLILAPAAGLLLVLVSGMAVRPAFAAGPFTVNTTADTHDANTGDGLCSDASAKCSLRAALEQANASGGSSTIDVPSGTYVLSIGELQAGTASGTSITIAGAGAATTIVSAGGSFRVLDADPAVHGNVALSVGDLTIADGTGGLFGGGGIVAGGPGDSLQVSNVTFTDNTTAQNNGGAISFTGGGSLTVANSTFTNNTSPTGNGGAIHFLQTTAGSLSITGSTFTGNSATGGLLGGQGGAINAGCNLCSPFSITSSTFTSNTAVRVGSSGGQGGAIMLGAGTATVRFDRIVDNAALGGGSGLYAGGGTVDATEDWWGCNSGPGGGGCDGTGSTGGSLTTSPFIKLTNTASPNPILVNQATTLTADFLHDSNGGSLTPTQVSTLIGLPVSWGSPVGGSLSNTQASIQSNGTATATFTAAFAGPDTANATVDSGTATAQITVNQAGTSTAITSETPDPTVTGESYTVAFSVSSNTGSTPTAPTGTVTVSDGTDSCSATIATGSCSLTSTTAGLKTLSATYGGDTNFLSSTSAGVAHTVDKADTTTTITSDTPDPSVVGQSVTVQYSVAANSPGGGTPTGNVTVSDGTVSCTSTVAAGQCSLAFTSAGSKSVTATYAGDADYSGSTSAAEAHQVDMADTTTTITSDSPDPSNAGDAVTVAFTVAPVAPGAGIPTGNVTVSDGAISCTATVATGQCSLTFTTAGARTLTAAYAGDSDFNGSTSAGEPHTVNGTATTTTITSDTPDPSVVGQSVTIQYSVVPASGTGTPTGNVTVSDGTISCTGTVVAGQCSLTFTTAGARTLTASYAGDSDFSGSTSAAEAHQVDKADTTTSITSDTPDPSALGASVTVTYTVAVDAPGAGTPTGSVTVSDGVDSCTGSVGAGSCDITLTTSGARTLTATYAGDSSFNGSTSAGEPHTVGTTTTTSITSDVPDPSVVGQPVAIQYAVTPTSGGGTPTGSVTVSDGTISCTGTVAAGQCSLTFTSAGTRSLTATYAGDGIFQGSTSAVEPHQVDKADTTTAITSDSPDPSSAVQAVTVQYTVTVDGPGAGTPTGNVTVSDGTVSCTATVAAGQCALTLTTGGTHTLTATYAGDSSFNGSTSAAVLHTVDASPPDTTILSGPTDPTDSTSASFTFTGGDDITPAASLTFECSLDGAAFTACSSPQSYSGLALGSHTFQVRAVDAVGNVDPSPASYTWQVHAATNLLYDGVQIVDLGSTFQPAAKLSSTASACVSGQTVTFALDTNPLTGVAGTYALGTATTSSTGQATMPAISTSGWLEGVYEITASYAGSASCDPSSDDATLTVAAPGDSATGGGWYTLSGSGRVNFGFTVRKVDPACTSSCAYKGSLLLINNGKWRLKGSLTGYVKTSSNQGAASGTGDLYWWDATLDGGLGDWSLAQSGVSFTISFYDGGKGGKKSTDTFGIGIQYTPVAPQPSKLPNSPPQPLKGGDIKVS